jgi:hypothetical protein
MAVLCSPLHEQDYKMRVYSRSKDAAIVSAIRAAFRKWLEAYNEQTGSGSGLLLCTPMKPQSSFWRPHGALPAAAAGVGGRAMGAVPAVRDSSSALAVAAGAEGEVGQTSQGSGGSGGEESGSQPSRKRQRSLAREFKTIAEGEAEGEQE